MEVIQTVPIGIRLTYFWKQWKYSINSTKWTASISYLDRDGFKNWDTWKIQTGGFRPNSKLLSFTSKSLNPRPRYLIKENPLFSKKNPLPRYLIPKNVELLEYESLGLQDADRSTIQAVLLVQVPFSVLSQGNSFFVVS